MARVSFPAVKRVAIALGWIILFYVVALGVDYGLTEVASVRWNSTLAVVPIGLFEVIGFGLATYVFGRRIHKHSWSELGWRRPALKPWLRGLALGAVMASGAVGLAVVFGARVHFIGDWNAWAPIALPLIIGLIIAALGEELGFRGYPVRHLADAVGVLPAIVILALPFAIAHAWNPSATVFSTINVGLAAIWLSIAFFSTGGMPLAWGAHFGWNAALAILFDAPVSGFLFHVPVVEYTPGMHRWIDGGAFGPEGGIVATIALTAGALFLLTRQNAFSGQRSVVVTGAVAA
jgi:hypothetical protein